MSKVEFVPVLPEKESVGRAKNPNWEVLTQNAGKWAKYWGPIYSVSSSVHSVNSHNYHPGFRFESAQRNKIPYVRAVKVES